MKDVRVQIGIGLVFFVLALVDQIHTGAMSLKELTIVGKVGCIGMGIVLAGFFVQVAIAVVRQLSKKK